MEHIEEAGVHSGDSACSLPPYSLKDNIIQKIEEYTILIAKELNVIGLMNVQYAVKDDQVYVLEVNPRASRTIPFVSKTIGFPLAKLAMKVMCGKKLAELGFIQRPAIPYVAVKEAVFPFTKFSGVDTLLGPEMKSTGEVMGLDSDFGYAFAKSQIASAARSLPVSGKVFISVKDKDKPAMALVALRFSELGFSLVATRGTVVYFKSQGIKAERVNKVQEGRPHIVDALKNKEISYVINTVGDRVSKADSYSIRRTALTYGIPYFTTVAEARALVQGVESVIKRPFEIKTLQEYHSEIKKEGSRG